MALRITVVGCGAVAQRLYRKPLQLLQKRGILEVVALVDPLAEHAAQIAPFFPGSAVYRELEQAFAESKTDLTLILSPAHLHCRQAIEAMRYGSHVLCEKPMACNDADCAHMVAVAAETNRVLAVAMSRRYFPAYGQLKNLLQDGQLGQLESFEYREGQKFEWDVTTPAAFRPRNQGGTGVLFDIGPHVADLLGWLFGELKVLEYLDDALAGIESDIFMQVQTPKCRGSIHLSWNCPQPNELRVVGSDGEAVLRVDRFDQLAVRDSAGFRAQTITISFPADDLRPTQCRLSPASYAEAIFCQLIQVVRAIRLGERPAVDGEAGRRCIALLESALSIARPLAMPWLDLSQQETFRRLHGRSGN